MNTTSIIVHGHFYQPPRVDSILRDIPQEEGAGKYGNWNEKIHATCYLPNAECGNFKKLNFNIGPTLWDWMETQHPQTCEMIQVQEHENFSQDGTSNAMAQPYHHTILPLADENDKRTQVRWGIRHYQKVFGHEPEGMWLPETAADYSTLQVLAEEGIRFTILAPWQAEEEIHTNQPYRVELEQGKSIAVFFYNQYLSSRISFDPTSTINADDFTRQFVMPEIHSNPNSDVKDQLLLMASDGELYGHHQSFRDLFISYFLNGSLSQQGIEPTYLSRWFHHHKTIKSIKIRENTSWSCMHGVERWRGECDCSPHGEWKNQLRSALDKIRKEIDSVFFHSFNQMVHDPLELRHQWIDVLTENATLEELMIRNGWNAQEKIPVEQINRLLTAQVEGQQMYNSCGWFFEDFDRIEPKNNVRHAAQAVWLTKLATGIDISNQSKNWLQPVHSWKTHIRADQIFEEYWLRVKENITK
jgi:hypothetical protein